MNNAPTHRLGSVGLVFVAVAASLALDVIWRIGLRVQTWFPVVAASTRAVIDHRAELTVAALLPLVVAIWAHRRPGGVIVVGVMGLFEVALFWVCRVAMALPYHSK